jgi:hypothetical protein
VNDRRRLEQLHVLLARLEQLPESPHREWMLREVRARAVDVESGVRPEPLRSLEPDGAIEAAAPKPPPRPARARPERTRPPEQVQVGTVTLRDPAPRPAAGDRVDLLLGGGRLSLEDESDEQAGSPWARGLRA